MASAKKGKKNKGKTLSLVHFLQETTGTVPSVPIRKSTLNWADEVEDNHDVYESRSSKANVVLPTAPKASRDFVDISDKVPMEPPFIAYLSNLPYDVDEEEISFFFKNMKIANMRIPKDDRSGDVPKLKGFGYVEFEDRESLLNALVIPDTTIKNRRIRIEVASDGDNDRRRPGGRMDMGRDRGMAGRSDASSDWRSGPRSESSEMEPRRGYRDNRDRDSETSSSQWRDGGDRRPNTFSRDREPDRAITRSTTDRFSRDDFRGDRDSFRGGERDGDFGGSRQRGGDRDRDGDFGSRNRGVGRDREGSDFRSRGERDDKFMSRRFDSDSRGDSRMDGGGFSRSQMAPRNPPKEESEPGRNESRQRPKLMLAPRTKPVEQAEQPEQRASATSIFGNAKPVDTSARERQIEERLAKDSVPEKKRDLSRDGEIRRDDQNEDVQVDKEITREEKDEEDRESAEYPEEEVLAHDQNRKTSESNGVVEKSPPKRNGENDHKREHVKESIGDPKHRSEHINKDKKKEERREKEMPKVKKAEAPNFIASNKFAYLETEDVSD